MMFETEFPGLKGRMAHVEWTCVCGCEGSAEHSCWFNKEDIEEHCVDKQRIREAIEKYITSKTTCNGFYNLTSLDIKQFEKELGL